MQNIVKEHIENILEKDVVLEKPKDISLGHFATPVAFSLAKEFRKNPMVIAQELANKFENSDIFEEVTAVKGFVNFKLSNKFLSSQINKALDKQEDFAKSSKVNQKILLEFVSANPTGPLHIGHGRTFTIADFIARFKRMKGFNVLWPQGWHITGAPIVGKALRLKEGDEKVIRELKEYGVPEEKWEELKTPEGWARHR